MPKEKRLFLLDAMALIYRAYFALNKNPRINSKGLNTSAILGFANSLLDILKNENPTHIGVAFDTFAPTHREADFTDYKAHREKMPEDIALALPYIRELIEGFNIPILEVEGYEADDVIGTLARKAGQEGYTTFMVTPDKDFGQLVAEKTFIYKPPRMGNKADILGVKEVLERYQIERPEQLTDILGLWGDASDNIPGIPGIGEKRAIELIRQYGSIENLLNHSGELQGKIRENLETFAEQGLMSKQLATIIQDVPIEFEEEQLRIIPPDKEALEELFNELEFRTFSRRVFGEETEQLPRPEVSGKHQPQLFDNQEGIAMGSPDPGIKSINDFNVSYHLVSGAEEIEALTGRLKEEPVFCFDTETTGLNPDNAELVGISFAFQPGEAFFVILPENFGECHDVIGKFKPFLEDQGKLKIGQNMKFDIAMLRWYDVEVKGRMFDTMLAHYLIEPDLRHNIDFLAETHLRYQKIPTEALIGKKGKEQRVMRQVDLPLLKDYACEDADITLQLYFKLDPLLGAGSLRRIFDEIEMPLVPVLASMEAEGVKLDTTALNEYSVELAREIVEVEKQVHALAGQEFNIASPQQLGKILFEKLRITDNPSRTQTKQYSTGEDVLQKLINRHPVVQLILDYRSLTKLKSTYVDTLPQLVSPRDNRIHTTYNQAVAATGRLSSNNPNLQNIPIRSERGREIRKAFVPRKNGYVLLSADYSQIELRIIAELSGDEAMQEAFRHGLDIHTATASKVYGMTLDLVSPEMRRNAKMVNFGIVYGISAFGLSERLGIPRREAGEIINAYFSQYPGIREYMDKTISKARETGYVETILGRRRYIRDINSSNATVRGFAERNAINAPIQGSSADMIKIAMIGIYEEFSKRNLKSKMILQVHDELVFDAHRDEIDVIKPIIMEKMVNAIPMKVPVVVEMNTGENWLEAH
jgi:DNA polymerase-1